MLSCKAAVYVNKIISVRHTGRKLYTRKSRVSNKIPQILEVFMTFIE